MKYLVSYDLNTPGQNYKELIHELEVVLCAKRVLKSQWIVLHSTMTANDLLEYLLEYIDGNDRLLVMTISDGRICEVVSFNLESDINCSDFT